MATLFPLQTGLVFATFLLGNKSCSFTSSEIESAAIKSDIVFESQSLLVAPKTLISVNKVIN